MKYKHTNRSGVLFILLNIITLSIYGIVVLSHVRREVNEMGAGRTVKKLPPFFPMWLLGLITLGIAPLIWVSEVADRLDVYAAEHEITKPRITYAKMFVWLLIGWIIIVGPFIAWHCFFKVLNLVEAKMNEEPEPAPAEAPQEEPVLLPEGEQPAPVEGEQPVPTAEGEPAPAPEEEPAPAPQEAPAPAYAPAPAPSYAPRPAKQSAPALQKKRYKVRYASREDAVAYFDTKEEAVEYAKSLVRGKGKKVIIKK